MANSIELVEAYRAIVDGVYKRDSLTARMDAQTLAPPEFDGTPVVKILKISTVGMGTYSRATGYPAGNITAAWESLTLSVERGRAFTLDRMDDEETLGAAMASVIPEYVRTQVIPEIDAYRFAEYASWSGVSTTSAATLSASTILAALNAAKTQMNEDEVPEEGRLLYLSSTVGQYLDAAVTRMLANEQTVEQRVNMFDGMPVIRVPQSRFYTGLTLDAGATASAGGYSKNGYDLNFMIIHPPAVVQATKLNQVKYFDPDVNQSSDGHLWQHRLYYGAFVEENKVDGIYYHRKAS
jgi:hypothetical protein